jgi:hypothetical protein
MKKKSVPVKSNEKNINYYGVDKCTRKSDELNINTSELYKKCVMKVDPRVETIRTGKNDNIPQKEQFTFLLNENAVLKIMKLFKN